jgi:tRNA (cytidine/uridine-2'-O-)-methyltransferase
MDLVLLHPEIPHNTGCVARTAAATGVRLHLVEPLGFSLADRYLKRAGLDYWPLVELVVHADWPSAAAALQRGSERALGERLWLFSARGGRSLFTVPFAPDDVLVLGRESVGLPQALLAEHAGRRVGIPIRPQVRSLNLAAAACLALYTALDRAGVALPQTDGHHQRDPRMDADLSAADVAVRQERGEGPSGGS